MRIVQHHEHFSAACLLLLACLAAVELRESECEALLSHCQELQRRLYMSQATSAAPAAPPHFLAHHMLPYVTAPYPPIATYSSPPYVPTYHHPYPYNPQHMYPAYPHVQAQTPPQAFVSHVNNHTAIAPQNQSADAANLASMNAMASSPSVKTDIAGQGAQWMVKGPLKQMEDVSNGS